ncbi:asp/glu/hydantoin racemase domain-containing protein [Fusarium flagelliforme]|uniref:Asp/glu/hydantoin racemase domain-containing protein n=1 Tax=Fusarium flagelliforme TaxID=2675880 RepID=A0A395MXZ8_9HYPO|nr:asp/glu/hydantoin racemase domain-containing protein [Fusarium flagelliforme]
MKTILLLGGMTPDVTALYYNKINAAVRTQLGNRTAAPLYMYSANLEDMIQHAMKGDWSSFAATYEEPINLLGEKVDGVAICAILAHKVAARLSDVAAASSVPLLHITDFLATYIKTNNPGVKRLGLLGPKISMLDSEDPDFFIGRLQSSSCGFQVIVPETEQDIEEVNRGMLEEVAKGVSFVTTSTKAMFIGQAKKLVARGAQVIILGSTDLGFVLKQEDLGDVPVIEPAAIHAEGLARWICSDTNA